MDEVKTPQEVRLGLSADDRCFREKKQYDNSSDIKESSVPTVFHVFHHHSRTPHRIIESARARDYSFNQSEKAKLKETRYTIHHAAS